MTTAVLATVKAWRFRAPKTPVCARLLYYLCCSRIGCAWNGCCFGYG